MVFKTIDTQSSSKFDWIKWLAVIFLLIAGIIVNYYYNYQPWPLRLLGWIFLLAIVGAIALQTHIGKQALIFVRESRMELRKVYWPTKQETMQTTLFIGLIVVILALFLWGVDYILVWLIGWLTGQRG